MTAPIASQKLIVIKRVHAIIYTLIVAAIFYVLYAAITKTYSVLLYISLGVLIIEAIARIVSMTKCPLTNLAIYYGDPKGYVGSSLISRRASRCIFLFFSLMGCIALTVLILDILKIR